MANDTLQHGQKVIEGRGYILDEPYITRYYDLQSAARMSYSIRSAGFRHDFAEGAFRYCELGCGNGITVMMLAALHPRSTFLGIDLNPHHVETARRLADEAGLDNVQFLQADFDEAARQSPLPFDYITVHGVYSWVDASVRESMFGFVSRFLKPKGIAYISYNAFPGWSAKEPIWRLLNRYSKRVSGNSTTKIREGLRFLDFLANSNAPYFVENPSAREHLEFLKSEDLSYISHEFCNDNFAPVYASDAFAHAAKYGLNYVAQAETCNNLGFERVPEQFRGYIDSIEDRIEREIWSSLLRNDFFRTDLYTKVLPEPQLLAESSLWDKTFMLIHTVSELPASLSCGSRELDITDPLIAGMIEVAGSKPLTLRQMCRHSRLRRYSERMIFETAQLLELSGYFGFLLHEPVTNAARKDKVWHFTNLAFRPLLACDLFKNTFGHLAAPCLGSTLRFEMKEALAILALEGRTKEKAAIEFARSLNEHAPDLLSYPASVEWARGYLDDFDERWAEILLRLGAIVYR